MPGEVHLLTGAKSGKRLLDSSGRLRLNDPNAAKCCVSAAPFYAVAPLFDMYPGYLFETIDECGASVAATAIPNWSNVSYRWCQYPPQDVPGIKKYLGTLGIAGPSSMTYEELLACCQYPDFCQIKACGTVWQATYYACSAGQYSFLLCPQYVGGNTIMSGTLMLYPRRAYRWDYGYSYYLWTECCVPYNSSPASLRLGDMFPNGAGWPHGNCMPQTEETQDDCATWQRIMTSEPSYITMSLTIPGVHATAASAQAAYLANITTIPVVVSCRFSPYSWVRFVQADSYLPGYGQPTGSSLAANCRETLGGREGEYTLYYDSVAQRYYQEDEYYSMSSGFQGAGEFDPNPPPDANECWGYYLDSDTPPYNGYATMTGTSIMFDPLLFYDL